MRLSTMLATSTLIAGVAFAQAGAGSITGELALEPVTWVIETEGDGPTSSRTENQTSGTVRLVGVPQGETGGGAGTLVIEMDIARGPQEANPTDIRIALQQDDETLIANSENIDLTLEAFQTQGSDLVLAGSFVATLTDEQTLGLVLQPDEGVILDGNFQATITGTVEQ